MASKTATNDSIVDEDNWVVQIDKMFRELDLNYLRDFPVCIYNVPRSLSSAKPEAFTPQLVALGPYHHFRPELYAMERFKLTAAKRVLNNLELNKVVHQEDLRNYGPQIRACFHKYIDLKDHTLIYTMVIDSLFLLDLLQNYAKDHQGHIGRSQRMLSNNFSLTKMDHLIHTGVKLTKDAIIRDVIMLENQIPTCMLRKMIMVINNSKDEDAASQELGSMLLSLCEALSPLPFERKISESEAGKHAHLLDLMYHLIVPPQENLGNKDHKAIAKPENNDSSTNTRARNTFKKCLHILKIAFGYVGKFLGCITGWLNQFPPLKPIAKILEKVMEALHIINRSDSRSNTEKDGPVVVMIPSVTELHGIGGVHFRPSKEEYGRGIGIKSIRFDEKKRTFYLPEIKLDVNTEVIMRNLVAYEALTKSESLLFTRYTELMKAIIDTVEDVQMLKKSEVVKSNLKDKEAEELFNGMSKSIGPTKTQDLEKEIAKVNKYFNNTDTVRAYRLITKYVYSSWKLCTLFVTFVLLALMVLQTFCSVYDCPRILKTGGRGFK